MNLTVLSLLPVSALFVLMVIGCGGGGPKIEDMFLRRHLWEKLDKPRGSDFTKAELQDITKLVISDGGGEFVQDLKGIENLSNLKELLVFKSHIQDISPLSKLTKLERLHFDSVSVSDLDPLSELRNLKQLSLYGANSSNLKPLSELVNLESLHLVHSRIFSVIPLADLTNLKELNLGNNYIVDISPLAGMTGLERLEIDRSPVSDISVVAKFPSVNDFSVSPSFVEDSSPLLQSGLGDGDTLLISGDFITWSNGVNVVKSLISRGVNCLYTCGGINP